MDELDRKILTLLAENARITVKEIATRVSLTSPAVSERMKRMEKSGIIAGYTVIFDARLTGKYIHALISISVAPKDRALFQEILQEEGAVEQCFHVTGEHSHMVKVSCQNIEALDKLISRLQKLGQTNTQIILSTTQGPGPVIYKDKENEK